MRLSGALKIRILLFLLLAGLIITALSIHKKFRKEEILNFDAHKIERRLHRKEEFVHNFLNNAAIFDSLKGIEHNEEWAQKLVPELRDQRHLYLHTFKNGKLKFWGAIRILLESDSNIREGSSFLAWKNGWYEVVKKSQGDFSVLVFIPIKANYPYQNQFLRNTFSPDLIGSDNLDIAGFNDNKVVNIRNMDGKYLFSVKLKSTVVSTFYSGLELGLWILAGIICMALVYHLGTWIARRGYIKLSILFQACFLLGLCLLSLSSHWGTTYFDIEIFYPRYYASSYFFPSIGDLLLNVLALTWLLSYIYGYRYQIRFSVKPIRKVAGYAVFAVLALMVFGLAYFTDNLFHGLINNSSIGFDLSNVLSLTLFSWLGILIFCFSALNIYLMIQTAFAIAENLNITQRELLVFFLALVTGFAVSSILSQNLEATWALFCLILFLYGWDRQKKHRQVSPGILIFTVLIFAVIASLKLSGYEFTKERETRKILASKLLSADDPNAVMLFYNLEKEILADPFIADYFSNPIASSHSLRNRLEKLYFAGYLSRYDFNVYAYDRDPKTLRGEPEAELSTFKNLVLAGAVKVSGYFYRVNNTFAFQQYFALLPLRSNGEDLGTLVIELRSKPLNEVASFPELLIDGKIKENPQIRDYSYAYYSRGHLINQYGKYIYNLSGNEFQGRLRDFVFVNTTDYNGKTYNHLIFRPSANKMIVVSREIHSPLIRLASVSFIFLILLFFALLVYFAHWLWEDYLNYKGKFRPFNWKHFIRSTRMLYKTRIQLSMVSAVVFTLLVTGFITYYNISQQYRQQQEADILNKVNKVSAGFDKLIRNGSLNTDEQTEQSFNTIAELNGTDLTLYDVAGNMILTTQPKIYENGLIAPKMNAMAFLYLNKLQKAEFINKEQIGRCSFIAAYVPLRNSHNDAVAYLGLPYFSNERDFDERIGAFINALTNVYALVFVAIGFFAVFVANRITNPLTLIRKSLSETKIGRKNDPIVWKRHDEIGHLIHEYNNMISALEDSTQKLARSERETAWREMAKQVAHEIKNPLTPLKLGVQLLEKSWKEKDPNFDRKFEKFSKSFVEQIESLSRIASEFSNFAKMPDTFLEKVYLPEVLKQSINLYRQSEYTSITLINKADPEAFISGDKDQLLRCFNNLIKNAIEARPEGRRGIIRIRVHNTMKNIFVEIEDNGSGLPEQLRSRLFTPNFTTKTSGTGLGLAFVKQALENMGGNISYKTEQDVGTTFYINIPLINC